MKTKKRCDFCLKIKPDNYQANEKVLNKDLSSVLVNLAGIDVPQEKLTNILTCQDCAISLMQAEPSALKVRTLLTKLQQRRKSGKRNSLNLTTNDDLEDSPSASSTVIVKSNKKSNLDKSSVTGEDSQVSINNSPNDSLTKQTKTAETKPKLKRRRSTIEKESNDVLTNDSKKIDNNNKQGTPKKTPKKVLNGKAETKATPSKLGKNIESDETLIGGGSFKKLDDIKPESKKQRKNSKTVVNNESQDENNKQGAANKSPKKTLTKQKKLNESANDSFLTPIKKEWSFQKLIDDEAPPTKKQRTESKTYSMDSFEGSQDELRFAGECMNCGKTFNHLERYEAHVLSNKCSFAKYECKDPDCLRRFIKLEKMHEHIKRKHPQLMDSDE